MPPAQVSWQSLALLLHVLRPPAGKKIPTYFWPIFSHLSLPRRHRSTGMTTPLPAQIFLRKVLAQAHGSWSKNPSKGATVGTLTPRHFPTTLYQQYYLSFSSDPPYLYKHPPILSLSPAPSCCKYPLFTPLVPQHKQTEADSQHQACWFTSQWGKRWFHRPFHLLINEKSVTIWSSHALGLFTVVSTVVSQLEVTQGWALKDRNGQRGIGRGNA